MILLAIIYYKSKLIIPSYHARMVNRRSSGDEGITDEHVVKATRFAAQVWLRCILSSASLNLITYLCIKIQEATYPADGEPAWFQHYRLQQQLQIEQQQLQIKLQQLQIEQQQLQIEQQHQQAIRHTELLSLIFNSNAISFNRAANNNIMALRGRDGNTPDDFPLSRSELFQLSSARCNTFLAAYDLPVGGTADQKRNRLATHIGLIL